MALPHADPRGLSRLPEPAPREISWQSTSLWGQTFLMGDRVAPVGLMRLSAFHRRAAIETAGDAWEARRVGFAKTRIELRRMGAPDPVATATIGWNGRGEIRLASANRFLWRWAGFWTHRLRVEDESERVVLTQDFPSAWRSRGRIELAPNVGRPQELLPLLLLVWNESVVHLATLNSTAAYATAGAA